MNRQTKFLLLAFLASWLTVPTLGQRKAIPKQNDKEALRKIEREWGDAFLKKNPNELSRILADD